MNYTPSDLELRLSRSTPTVITSRVWPYYHCGEEVLQSTVTQIATHLTELQEVPVARQINEGHTAEDFKIIITVVISANSYTIFK